MLGEGFRALARHINKKVGDKKGKLRKYQIRDFIKDRKVDKKEDKLKDLGVKNAKEVAEKDKSFNHKRIEFLKNKLKLEIALDRFKVLTLYVASFIVDIIQAVIKMLIILLSNIYVVILLGAVVVVIALFSALAVVEEGSTNKQEQPQVSDQIEQGQQGGGGASWTLEELAIRGSMLSTYEKNLYKLIMLSNNAITGVYDGKPVTYPEGSDFALPLRFAVGIFSTENSGVMYLSGENTKDILVTPTDDTEINSSGYGSLFGIHHTDTLSRYYDATAVAKIKQMFPTSYTGNEIFFIPYGSGISVKHFNDKLQYGLNLIKKHNLEDDARSVIKSFGIVKGEEEVYRFCIYMLATALYHGGNIFDFPDITAFISALYASTSDVDAERSFDKIEYCYTDKYDESNFRLAVIGSCGYANVDNYNTPLDLPKSSTSAYFKVGNDTVKEPLWAYLYRKHSSNANMVNAWKNAKEYASGDLAVRVLNFHYGLNSYLQGDRIIKRIEGKLTGTPSNSGGNIVIGNFTPTKGKGQGVWDGKSVEDTINDYLKTHKNASSFLNGLKPHFGTASNYTPNSNIAGIVWKPIKFKVPFYGQGSRFGESYGNLKYHPNGETFNVSGCMVYAHAYAMSAMTGRLINPAELSAMMYMGGYFNGSGLIYGSKMPSLYKKLGINAEVLPDLNSKNWVSNWSKVDACLDKGGVAVVRATGSPYASGSNHYLVITSRVDGGSEKMYSMYTSSNVKQTNELHSESKLRANLHREITLVWK